MYLKTKLVEIYFGSIFEYPVIDTFPFATVAISHIKYYLAVDIQEMYYSNVFYVCGLKLEVHNTRLN